MTGSLTLTSAQGRPAAGAKVPTAASGSAQSNRLVTGGLIDRAAPLNFAFDGKTMTGFAGDTLASALVANG
ncbi:hypothetical protein EN795_35905, partial [bacterium M00.F.Ca.ET.152.01.1.1]